MTTKQMAAIERVEAFSKDDIGYVSKLDLREVCAVARQTSGQAGEKWYAEAIDSRPCTCPPGEGPRLCPHKHALSECLAAANLSPNAPAEETPTHSHCANGCEKSVAELRCAKCGGRWIECDPEACEVPTAALSQSAADGGTWPSDLGARVLAIADAYKAEGEMIGQDTPAPDSWAATLYQAAKALGRAPGLPGAWPDEAAVERALASFYPMKRTVTWLPATRSDMRAALLAAGAPPHEWRPVEDELPDIRERVILGWKAFPGMAAHIELGWRTATGWANTYGKQFSGAPDYWMRPHAVPAPPSDSQGGVK